MALVRDEIGFCKRCRKRGMFMHCNGKQSQDYCKLCEPIVELEEIDKAVRVLESKGVTPETYERFWNNHVKKK